MIIFIPIFVVLFIAVPVVLTHLVARVLGIRDWALWFVLFMVIAVVNWQAWQAPPAAQVSAQR